jgi:hypothetical protein
MTTRSAWKLIFPALIILPLMIFLSEGCASRKISRELTQVTEMRNISPKREYLKVHLKNGNLYVLHSWKYSDATRIVTGLGNYLDVNRRIIESRGGKNSNQKADGKFTPFAIPFDDIVIIETNDKGSNPGVAVMILTALATVPIAIYCVTNPKACFGSCPTFYVENDSTSKLVAEGFSSSITKSLEAKDIDHIDLQQKSGTPLSITVKNEALETHMIGSINLIACEKKGGSHVLQDTDGDFYATQNFEAPVSAMYGSASVLKQISKKDIEEWFSLADSGNLAKKENIFLEFKNPGTASGLVIDKRQSLMTTFLFYHSLSLTGNATSYYIGEMEKKSWMKKRVSRMYDLLGGIEVSVQQGKKWIVVKTVHEAGPIVSDVHLVRLPENKSEIVKVRLRMGQGLWRINMVNLTILGDKVTPQRIIPNEVLRGSATDPQALRKLIADDEYLVTFPGDVYKLNFPEVSKSDYEYFIESQGYYIEWMREEWLVYQDLKAAKKILVNPSRYLKKMAPAYKAVEPEMEKFFWNSRYTAIEN